MKYSLLLGILMCSGLIQTQAAERATASSPTDSELREWSIEGRVASSDPEESKNFTHCGVNNFYFLSRPGETKIVAVIQDGYILNPQRTRFNYGPIPPLKLFTEHTANVLWGAASTITQSDVHRYKLITNGAPKIGTEFFIEAVFHEGQLEKYRIASADGSKKWLEPR